VSENFELDDFASERGNNDYFDNSYKKFPQAFPCDSPMTFGDQCQQSPVGELVSEMAFGSEVGSNSPTPSDVQIVSATGETDESGNNVSTYCLGVLSQPEVNVHDRVIQIRHTPTPNMQTDCSIRTTSPTYASNTMYTDGGASESTLDTSAHHATSIYEANIATEQEVQEVQESKSTKAVLQNKKVFLGALVKGKLLNKMQNLDAPLYEDYDRPDDMNINPLFYDDGVQQGYAYMSTSQADPQTDGHQAQRKPSGYGVDASAVVTTEATVTRPLQAVVIEPNRKIVSPKSPVLVRTVSAPTVFTQTAFVVHTPTESTDFDAPASPQLHQHGQAVTSRPETPTITVQPGEQMSQMSYITQSAKLQDEEFYFVDSEALETLNIPEESVEDYVYANRGELVITQQSET
jgi:hypothetical protein